jgi:hypothetical protein
VRRAGPGVISQPPSQPGGSSSFPPPRAPSQPFNTTPPFSVSVNTGPSKSYELLCCFNLRYGSPPTACWRRAWRRGSGTQIRRRMNGKTPNIRNRITIGIVPSYRCNNVVTNGNFRSSLSGAWVSFPSRCTKRFLVSQCCDRLNTSKLLLRPKVLTALPCAQRGCVAQPVEGRAIQKLSRPHRGPAPAQLLELLPLTKAGRALLIQHHALGFLDSATSACPPTPSDLAYSSGRLKMRLASSTCRTKKLLCCRFKYHCLPAFCFLVSMLV